MFWIRKIITSKHKAHLLKRALKLKSFRFLREIYYSIKHPEERDLYLLPKSNETKNMKLIFVDIGAFEGDFSRRFFSEHPDSKAYLIEPVPEFVDTLRKRFSSSETVIIPTALTASGTPISLSDEGASSSSHEGHQVRTYPSISVSDLFQQITESKIDLLQVNCEGGEYEILPEMINGKYISRINALNIQFHYLSPRNIIRRQKIVNQLKLTHELVWNVPFIWERWELKQK
jgi:FkbM family methyltransferase